MKMGKLALVVSLSLSIIAPLKVSAALKTDVAPGGNFNLSGFQLQLPIGSSGSPTMIPGSSLAGANGYTNQYYFYTDKTDGSMVMMDPTTGVTTSGSAHCRTELREMPGGWSTSGTNVLSVTAAVTKVPSNVCIGQIFQATGPSKPLCELQYKSDGTLNLFLENTNQGGGGTTTKVGSVPLGQKFTYTLSLSGTTITVTINGAATTFTLPPTFVGETFYFKAGDYDQTATSGTSGTTPGTIVKIYSLNINHNSAAIPVGTTLYSLQSKANNEYICADNYGNDPLTANRDAVGGEWEEYQVINNDDGTISLKSMSNGNYVCADLNQGAKLIARSTSISKWEEFKKVTLADGTIALQALANDLYVSTDLNNGAVLSANKSSVGGAWEAFTLSAIN